MSDTGAESLAGLGRDAEALADLDAVAVKLPTFAKGFRLRALVHARSGHARAARADLATFRKLNGELGEQAAVEARVGVWLGDEGAGLERLSAALRREPHNRDLHYEAARVYAQCSDTTARLNAAQAAAVVGLSFRGAAPQGLGATSLLADLAKRWQRPSRYAERGLALLRRAVAEGYHDFAGINSDADLAPLFDFPEFTELLRQGLLERRFSSVRHELTGREAAESHGLGLEDHRAKCRELAEQGYRPLVVSAMSEEGDVATASIWQRPSASTAQRERLARRQAQAAATLLLLGDADPVWPLFRRTEQPEQRSQLVWRAGLLGVDPVVLVRRLDLERDVSARRALIVALGDYSAEQLLAAESGPLTRRLLDWYENDPDPGIHGAVDWLLRPGKEGPDNRPLDWGQATELARIDERLKRRDPDGKRNWYVNRQGQTMVLIPGPVEFHMGCAARRGGSSAQRIAASSPDRAQLRTG